VEASEASPESRRAALVAAAALIGPTVPGGIVDRHPDEAATAVVRVAGMFLPWLEDGTALPVPERVRKRQAAVTVPGAVPGTGDDDGPEGAGSEAE
jgi:hypothetical protein